MQHLTQYIYPGPVLELFAAAQDAMAKIPPAFPLSATVAVNPFLGQIEADRAEASALLEATTGHSLFPPRTEFDRMIRDGALRPESLDAVAQSQGVIASDLSAAVARAEGGQTLLPTLADLAREATGIAYDDLIRDRISLWASGYFDEGQALWPTMTQGTFRAWRAFASRDLSAGLAGLSEAGPMAESLPDNPRAAFTELCARLELSVASAPLYFQRLLMSISGWAQFARHKSWVAERDDETDSTLFALLTARLAWDVILYEHHKEALADAWADAKATYAKPVEVGPEHRLTAALQEAVDHQEEDELHAALQSLPLSKLPARPALQAAFCIDVRSEVLRRALEKADPGLQTIGFAGFFGLPVAHKCAASDTVEARAPILLRPAITTEAKMDPAEDKAIRVHRRALRAWGRFKMAAVSSFAFVEAAGPFFAAKLTKASLGLKAKPMAEPAPHLDMPLTDRIGAAKKVLQAMSLTKGFARLVLIAGHGSSVANAPHASALQCGACGGHAGDTNARLLAALLNEGEVRAGLVAEGIEIPDDTHFVAGKHDTVSDKIHLFEADLGPDHQVDLARLMTAIDTAGAAARGERAEALPRAQSAADLLYRGKNWAELRPEWGLAGCKAFVAAPRSSTSGLDLGGRVFLHDYDHAQDSDEHATLELILTAPVVVASWISLQYFGSSAVPQVFGAGNKLLHNVTGGLGVLEGAGGDLRVGLPMQSVSNGDALQHRPVRLAVVLAAPVAAIETVLNRNPAVKALFDNGWLSLASLDTATGAIWRYDKGDWRLRVADSAGQMVA